MNCDVQWVREREWPVDGATSLGWRRGTSRSVTTFRRCHAWTKSPSSSFAKGGPVMLNENSTPESTADRFEFASAMSDSYHSSRRREFGPQGPPNQEALATIFPGIADYAFLSDCENTCLVAPTGSIEWLCLPRPHDASVFGTILDRAAGSFRLAPIDSAVPAHRQYVPGTMVLATTWQTRSGWLIVTDFMAIGPWYRTGER